MPEEASHPQARIAGGLAEAKTFARASISSIAATLVDGVAYQAVLFVLAGKYGAAALAGAVLGAVTNFTINRYWAFPPTKKGLAKQIGMYAIASGSTYVGLQLSLWLFIEALGWNERIAWLPAKAIAWLAVSYPLHRFVVFTDPDRVHRKNGS